MKRSELKQILKPLIKECVREAILEEGILSGIISEVARGVGGVRVEQTAPQSEVDPLQERMKRNAFNNGQEKKLREHKTKLMAAIGESSYNGANLFEGTTPTAAQLTPSQQATPMAGTAPNDSGVNINSLFESVGRNWNAHMSGIKREK
jgi:hypothetical protein|tara:strand:- start:741 stop:1187 length:447 start_codon:yes stop_codon:yes gene_type:complete